MENCSEENPGGSAETKLEVLETLLGLHWARDIASCGLLVLLTCWDGKSLGVRVPSVFLEPQLFPNKGVQEDGVTLPVLNWYRPARLCPHL